MLDQYTNLSSLPEPRTRGGADILGGSLYYVGGYTSADDSGKTRLQLATSVNAKLMHCPPQKPACLPHAQLLQWVSVSMNFPVKGSLALKERDKAQGSEGASLRIWTACSYPCGHYAGVQHLCRQLERVKGHTEQPSLRPLHGSCEWHPLCSW